jgi:S1-C subfamily serine protease
MRLRNVLSFASCLLFALSLGCSRTTSIYPVLLEPSLQTNDSFQVAHYPKYEGQKHPISNQVAKPYKTVVSIMGIAENKIQGIGAGVVIQCEKGKKKRILTAWHVIEALEEIGSPILAGSTVQGKVQIFTVLDSDTDADLGVLEGLGPEKQSCPAAKVSRQLPRIGSYVWIIGRPMGHEGNVSHGVLSSVYDVKRNDKQVTVYRTDAPVAPGNSGGGMFNSKGELIGIVSFMELLPNIFSPYVPVPVPGGGAAIGLPKIWALLDE